MTDTLHCWQCDKQLKEVILPLSRREECSACHADQHVCKMCQFFTDTNRCQEDRAEDISNRERANFCDYFKPRYGSKRQAALSSAEKSAQAQAKFADLFGDEPLKEATHLENNNEQQALTPAQIAEKKLRDLLGG